MSNHLVICIDSAYVISDLRFMELLHIFMIKPTINNALSSVALTIIHNEYYLFLANQCFHVVN